MDELTATPVDHPAKPCPALQVIPIDPDGDLLLRVGTELPGVKALDFRVCSAALRRASPVWKAMLFGSWAEAKPTDGDWIVQLPEDKPVPAIVLLSIAHGSFDPVPNKPEFDWLYNIVIFADKYDLFHIIRPWVHDWVETIGAWPATFLLHSARIRRIHIAWEFGCEDVVRDEITRFVFNLESSGWLTSDSHSGPPDLVEVLLPLRLSLIQTLLDFYHAEWECRIPPKSGCELRGYYQNDQKSLCDCLIIGGMWQNFEKTKQTPLAKNASQYPRSANELLNVLSGIFRSLPKLNHQHADCGPAQKFLEFEKKTREDERYTHALRPHHKKFMAERREKLGL